MWSHGIDRYGWNQHVDKNGTILKEALITWFPQYQDEAAHLGEATILYFQYRPLQLQAQEKYNNDLHD
jgi:hypothetical protein